MPTDPTEVRITGIGCSVIDLIQDLPTLPIREALERAFNLPTHSKGSIRIAFEHCFSLSEREVDEILNGTRRDIRETSMKEFLKGAVGTALCDPCVLKDECADPKVKVL